MKKLTLFTVMFLFVFAVFSQSRIIPREVKTLSLAKQPIASFDEPQNLDAGSGTYKFGEWTEENATF